MAKVLLVDDEASLLELLGEIVGELGHTVSKAINGQKALISIRQEQPDLVISDVMMPEMNGYGLLHQIRLIPEWHKIKTILVSAAPIDRNRKPPADAYISKPYNLDLMENLIQKCVSFWRSSQKLLVCLERRQLIFIRLYTLSSMIPVLPRSNLLYFINAPFTKICGGK